MLKSREALPTALPFCMSNDFFQWRCASREREAVKAVPRQPPKRISSCVMNPMGRSARMM